MNIVQVMSMGPATTINCGMRGMVQDKEPQMLEMGGCGSLNVMVGCL